MLLDLLDEPLKACLAVGTAVSALTLLERIWARRRHQLPLPPGPKGLPLIGNLLDIPQVKPWETYTEWGKQYGDIVYFNAVGQSFIVLNSLTAVNDLLTARATKYSDRAESPLLELTGIDSFFAFKQYGNDWRNQGRSFHRFFNQTQVHKFRPIIREEVYRLLSDLISPSQPYRDIFHEYFALVIMRAAYGSEDYQYNRNLIREAASFVNRGLHLIKPGAYLVGIVHSLRHVPSWFPGAGWKRIFLNFSRDVDKMIREPFEVARGKLDAGIQGYHGLNVATGLIADLPSPDSPAYAYQEGVARETAAMCYLAGSDTTDAAAMALIYVLAANPQVQKQAQEEIDRVVGVGRLPDFSDFGQLHYLQAVIKELARWHTVLPLCVPHVSSYEDEYMGYRIPAKTMILPNTWAIMHDSENFEDPMAFNPERYLKDGKTNPDILDPEEVTFGFGRRICPGRHFSTEALMLMATSVLACFDVTPPKDEKGQELPMGPMDVGSLTVAAPLPFSCSITPRSEHHTQLIKSLNDLQ